MFQFILHALAMLSLATVIDTDSVKLLPFLTCVFVIGRILFMIGYRVQAKARAFGFALTSIPTVLVLVKVVYTLYVKGFDSF